MGIDIILIKDESGIGFGDIYSNDEKQHIGQIYQNRLNAELIDKKASFNEFIEDLSMGKSYIIDIGSKLETVNEMLEFYFKEKIEIYPDNIELMENISVAVEHLENNKLEYFICQIRI